jgi:hypothetical protein
VLPLIGDDGYMNVGTVVFFTSYTIVVNWTLLQVRKHPAQPEESSSQRSF